MIRDTNFTGRIYPKNNESFKWVYISKVLGRIITVENDGEIKLYILNTQRHNIYDIFSEEDKEKNLKIISSELYELVQTAECKLLVILNDLSFFYVDLLILNSQTDEREEYDIEKIINSLFQKDSIFNHISIYLLLILIHLILPIYKIL